LTALTFLVRFWVKACPEAKQLRTKNEQRKLGENASMSFNSRFDGQYLLMKMYQS